MGVGLFGEVIVNDQGMLLVVTEILSHRTTRIRGDVLQRGRVTGTGRYDSGVFHGTVFFKHGVDLGHRRFFLPAGHIDAINICILLRQDRIDGTGGFADLAVADDEFALPPSDRRHGINRFEAGIAGFMASIALRPV